MNFPAKDYVFKNPNNQPAKPDPNSTDIKGDTISTLGILPASLFFTPNKKFGIASQNSSNSILSVQFGIILEEAHSLESNISEHPVQDGSPITDHIQNLLRKGSLKALVSNHSIIRGFDPQPPPEASSWNGVGSLTRPTFRVRNVALETWEQLKAVWKAKQLVTIVCVMETYTNVAIKSISTIRNGDTGDGQEFDITFQEVRIVQIGKTTIVVNVNPSTSTGKKVAKKENVGKKATEEVGGNAGGVVKPTAMQSLYKLING